MHQRGLLADTLVCFVTEFGRTPKMNDRQGRDHWTNAFSFALRARAFRAGRWSAARTRGRLHHQPDGLYHRRLRCNLYEKLGIDRSKPLYTPINRPIYLAAKGRPIPELF